MVEKWKEIKGYEGCYEVSNFGNVRSIDRYVTKSNGVVQHRKQCMKTKCLNKDGYHIVSLNKNGINKKCYVHTLVATAFVDGWFDGAEVNHKDFDRTNNFSENLEWVAHSKNVRHTIDAGRHVCQTDICGENNPNFGNHILSEKYKDKEYAILKQSRPGSQNGRAIMVRMYDCDKFIDFDYIGECAKYMIDNGLCKSKSETSVSAYISKAAKSGKPYYGYKFSIIDNAVPSFCGNAVEGVTTNEYERTAYESCTV